MDMTIYPVCDNCGYEHEAELELDGYKVLGIVLDNDDSGLACADCGEDMDEGKLYELASIAAAGG